MLDYTIVIPTLNRADLLKHSYEDLKESLLKSENCKSLIIIDNGKQNLSFIKHPKSHIFQQEKNLGVAASWNMGLDIAFNKNHLDVAVVLNDDIVFGKTPEELQKLIQTYDLKKRVLTSTEHWCVFLIGNSIYEKVGPFDELYYPAYYEDTDYKNRIILSGHYVYNLPELNPKVFNNSMTIKKDSGLNKNFNKNKEYFFKKWSLGGTLPRITEVFMYNGEIEALKTRIIQTYKHVDRWIIVEGDHTFQGEKKEQAFIDDLLDPFFEPFSDRIVPMIYNFKNPKQGAWDNEYELRNFLKSKLPENRWCMISDLDEIPDYDTLLPRMWQTLPDKTKVYTPELWDQYYNTRWVFENKIQAGSLFFNDLGFNNITAQKLRSRQDVVIPNGGWHLSYFMSPEDIANKLNSFAHSEFNTPYYKNLERINKCIKEGKDLFDRPKYNLRPSSYYPTYTAPAMSLETNSLRELGLKYNSDKASYHNFCGFYERVLPKQRITGNVLEIGVNLGSSIRMWSEWLPECDIEGWDIDLDKVLKPIPNNVELKQVDQSVSEDIKSNAKDHYSLIIDDGSHKWEHQRLTFNLLWPKCDIYIMEDFHTSVNSIYGPGAPIYDEKKEKFVLDFQDMPHEKIIFKGKEKDSWTAIFIKK